MGCNAHKAHNAYQHARHRSLLTCSSGGFCVEPAAEPVLSLQHAAFDIVCFAWLLQHKAQSITYNRLSSRSRCCVVQTGFRIVSLCYCIVVAVVASHPMSCHFSSHQFPGTICCTSCLHLMGCVCLVFNPDTVLNLKGTVFSLKYLPACISCSQRSVRNEVCFTNAC